MLIEGVSQIESARSGAVCGGVIEEDSDWTDYDAVLPREPRMRVVGRKRSYGVCSECWTEKSRNGRCEC